MISKSPWKALPKSFYLTALFICLLMILLYLVANYRQSLFDFYRSTSLQKIFPIEKPIKVNVGEVKTIIPMTGDELNLKNNTSVLIGKVKEKDGSKIVVIQTGTNREFTFGIDQTTEFYRSIYDPKATNKSVDSSSFYVSGYEEIIINETVAVNFQQNKSDKNGNLLAIRIGHFTSK